MLGPTAATPRTWKLMLARTPPVWLVTSVASEPATVMSISPAVCVFGVKVHVPLGGGLVSSDPGVTSVSDTEKTVGSYVRTTSAEFRPWSMVGLAESKRWPTLRGTVTTVPWLGPLVPRKEGMLKKA